MPLEPAAGGEAVLEWHRSSYSSNDGPDCVEVAASPSTLHVRDSKDMAGPHLAFASAAWRPFLAYAVN